MDYQAPFTLNQTIVQALTAALANGNLAVLAANPLASGQYNRDTIDALQVFTVPATYDYIVSQALTNNGGLVLIGSLRIF